MLVDECDIKVICGTCASEMTKYVLSLTLSENAKMLRIILLRNIQEYLWNFRLIIRRSLMYKVSQTERGFKFRGNFSQLWFAYRFTYDG